MIAQHSSKTDNHFTPQEVVDLARRVLGKIDLDPASNAKANKVVRATRYFNRRDDGLTKPWRGRIFLNPPGGTFTPKRKSEDEPKRKMTRADASHYHQWQTDSRVTAWWRKLTEEYSSERVKEAIFIGFTLEILRTAQAARWDHPFDFAICVPRDRMRFGGNSPTHANVIVYLGQRNAEFERWFEDLGLVKR